MNWIYLEEGLPGQGRPPYEPGSFSKAGLTPSPALLIEKLFLDCPVFLISVYSKDPGRAMTEGDIRACHS